MKISIIAVGKIKEKYLKDGIAEYSKRLSRFSDIEVIEVEDEQAPENLSAAQELQIKRREADKISRKIKDGATVIVLDVKGDRMDSIAFAGKLDAYLIGGSSNLVFVIGGSLGLAPELVKSAHLRLSMSEMTFPHQLARLVLLEQLFRAFKIMKGETYHK